MANVYCLECRHFGFYNEKGTDGTWVCNHPNNVGADYKDNWLSYGNIKIFTDAPSVKNANNDCSDYEEQLI